MKLPIKVLLQETTGNVLLRIGNRTWRDCRCVEDGTRRVWLIDSWGPGGTMAGIVRVGRQWYVAPPGYRNGFNLERLPECIPCGGFVAALTACLLLYGEGKREPG